MRGSIIKRYKRSYSIVLNLGVDPATGWRKQQWVSVKGTRKDTEKRHLVAHTGFEPVISSLRGRCPKPLDECAT